MASRVRTKYEADDGTIYAMVMSPTYAPAAGVAPTGAVTSPIKAKISKSTKAYGIKPRGVTLSRTLGTEPDTFTKTTFLPVLTASVFASAAFSLGATITIDGTAWTVVAKRGEDY